MDIFDFLYPKHCINCKKSGKYLCKKCLRKMPFSRSICYKCRNFSTSGATHSFCLRKNNLNGIYSIWSYQGVVGQAIKKIKYHFSSDLAEELIDEFVKQYNHKPLSLTSPVLVSIPLHPSRKRWRGFNQSELLGKLVAEKLNWDFEPNLLLRTKNTKPQVDLNGKARHQNVKNIFSLNPKDKFNLKSREVVVFDDVATTGSTLHEAGKVLKKNGAKTVWGMTVAS